MVGKKIDNKWYIRLQKGEEIVSSLTDFCKQNQIALGTISGIGACSPTTLGIFLTKEKKYISKTLTGDMELTSLLGTVSTMNGEVYLHLHATVGDESLQTHSGHLSAATISATGEIVIDASNGTIDREKDEEIGINLWNLL